MTGNASMAPSDLGNQMYVWAEELFPICRSLTGPGVRETLDYLQGILPSLEIHAVPSGTRAFDWTVPDEWCIRDAYIENKAGKRIVDFADNNLHVVGYSAPVNRFLSLEELDKHLHSLPDQPQAIPYVTSYYRRTWGFCLTDDLRRSLPDGEYRVVIDSELKPGVLNYGELLIKGESSDEILLSTYICHPSMANNELSGPVVTAAIARWLGSLEKVRYTYRVVFIPETIGSIVYLSRHHEHLKKHVKAGYVVTCIGDERAYSFLPSRMGSTLADCAAEYVLDRYVDSYDRYTYLDRGSDERQYCSPNIDLPVCSVMRSKYGTYPEYHTSLDDLSLISPDGLQGGFNVIKKIIKVLESNYYYKGNITCEPQLGKHGLYPTISVKNSSEYDEANVILDLLAYADGCHDLLQISKIIKEDFFVVHDVAEKLMTHGIIDKALAVCRTYPGR